MEEINIQLEDNVYKSILQLKSNQESVSDFINNTILNLKNENDLYSYLKCFIPEDYIEKIKKDPTSLTKIENKKVSIMVIDIKPITKEIEQISPENIITWINNYLSLMIENIYFYDGIVIKIIGDAILAYFESPDSEEKMILNSVNAAFEALKKIKEFNIKMEEMKLPQINIGIAINFGVVSLGAIGNPKLKMEYNLLGDMVNLTYRLEALTKTYKEEIIIPESIYSIIKEKYPCRLIDRVVIKGKTNNFKIFTLKDKLSEKEAEVWKNHNLGLKLYYEQKFEQAKEYFQNNLQIIPEEYLSIIMIKRCDNFLKNPPESDWNGVDIKKNK